MPEVKNPKLTYKKKVIVLFIEYFVFAFVFQVTFKIFRSFTTLQYINDFFQIFFLSFFSYYSFCELRFKKTLVMHLFGIELDNQNKMSFRFIVYSITSILDRTIFAPIHMLLAFMNYEIILLSEKLSGIRWKLSKNN